MKDFKTKKISFYDIFKDNQQWYVPKYQRRYEWVEENIEEFFSSISEHKNDLYYFGNVIVIKKENGYEVVDGQQRITTLYLFLYVILNILNKKLLEIENQQKQNLNNEQWRKLEQIKQKIIYSREKYIEMIYLNENTEEGRQLKLQEKDDKMLSKIITPKFNLENVSSKGKVNRTVKLFYSLVNDYINSDDEKLINLAEKTLSSDKNSKIDFMITLTIVDDDADAYQLFEAINDTGKDLSISDLLKNQIMAKLNNFDCNIKDLDQIEKIWLNIIEELSKIKENHKINVSFDKYLEIFYMTEYLEYKTKKEVYKSLKKQLKNFNTKEDIQNFVNKMLKKLEKANNKMKEDEYFKIILNDYKVLSPILFNQLNFDTEINYGEILFNLFLHYDCNEGRANKIQPLLKDVIKIQNEIKKIDNTKLFANSNLDKSNLTKTVDTFSKNNNKKNEVKLRLIKKILN